MVHVIARITLKPEAAELGKRVLEELAAATRRETGCTAYELFQRTDAPHVFQTVEQWQDQAAVDGHMKSAHVGAAIAAVGSVLAMAPEIHTFAQLR